MRSEKPSANQAGGGENQGVVFAGVQFAQPGIDVAADFFDCPIAADVPELRLPPNAAGADPRSRRQCGEFRMPPLATSAAPKHRSGLRVPELRRASARVWRFGRQILQAVHGDVGPAIQDRSCTSRVNTPTPPNCRSGSDWTRSPVVVTGTNSTDDPGTAAVNNFATCWACHCASGLARVAMRIEAGRSMGMVEIRLDQPLLSQTAGEDSDGDRRCAGGFQ